MEGIKLIYITLIFIACGLGFVMGAILSEKKTDDLETDISYILSFVKNKNIFVQDILKNGGHAHLMEILTVLTNDVDNLLEIYESDYHSDTL